jgi:hypothetical protein
MNDPALSALLERLETLLTGAGEARWADRVGAWAIEFSRLEPGSPEFQQQVRQVLGVFAGMGSFQDVVLQDRSGVRPENAEFSAARGELFEALRQRIR